MREIPDRPFDKIAIDLVMECKTSNSGNMLCRAVHDYETKISYIDICVVV